MHGCAVVLAATWETAVASLAFAMLFASIAYCAGKLWKHDRDIVELRARIAAIEQNCTRHQAWAAKLQETTQRIDRTVAKIAGSLNVDLDGP